MRIAFISTLTSSWGGSEVLWTDTARLALENGHQVHISLYKCIDLHPVIKELKGKGASISFRPLEVEIVNPLVRKIGYICNKKFPLLFFKPIERFKPDVTLVSMGSSYDFIWQVPVYEYLNRLTGRFILLSQLNLEHKVLNLSELEKARIIYKKCEKCYFVSARNLLLAQNQMAMNIGQAEVISNPLKIQYAYTAYPIDDSIKFASVARYDVWFKGQDILLQVLGTERWKVRNWTLGLYGSGKDEFYIKELIKYHGLENKVYVRGQTNDIAGVWQSHHALLMPSYHEGTPLALIEAMAAGRTAVVTNVGGNAELIQDGHSGFIAQGASVECYDEALERAWRKKSDWEEMGRKCFESLKDKLRFSPHEHILSTLEDDEIQTGIRESADSFASVPTY